jgi:hypothetical protein
MSLIFGHNGALPHDPRGTMFRAGFVLAGFIASALACQRVANEPRTGDERPASPVPRPVLSPVTDWVTVDGVAVRIHKMIVQPPVVEELVARPGAKSKWRERELESPALVVWVQIKNRTEALALPYNGFANVGPQRTGPRLIDEFGNGYAVQNHESATRRLRDRAPRAAIASGDEVVTDVLCFDPPRDAVTTLTLTLPALTASTGDGYQFTLPGAAWKR